MTTGAYADAIKAFENADTVEVTAESLYQKARCFVCINEIESAILAIEKTLEIVPDDILLKYDLLVLEQITILTDCSKKLSEEGLTAADVKNCDSLLQAAVKHFTELIKIFEAEKHIKLKR
jgi:tetratricopeptide (TPR) repeat protein